MRRIASVVNEKTEFFSLAHERTTAEQVGCSFYAFFRISVQFLHVLGCAATYNTKIVRMLVFVFAGACSSYVFWAAPFFEYSFYAFLRSSAHFFRLFDCSRCDPAPKWTMAKTSRISFKVIIRKLRFWSFHVGGRTRQVYPHWESRLFRTRSMCCSFCALL